MVMVVLDAVCVSYLLLRGDQEERHHSPRGMGPKALSQEVADLTLLPLPQGSRPVASTKSTRCCLLAFAPALDLNCRCGAQDLQK